MAYDNERIERAVKVYLASNFASTLDSVETLWASADPVTLPDVVTWFLGHKPTLLELPSTSFPFISTMIAGRTPAEKPSRWGYQEQDITGYVDAFVVADDEATVNKRAHRFAEAVVTLMQAQRDFEGYSQKDHEPKVGKSEASRHPKSTTGSNMFDAADVDFIQGVRIEFTLRGG